MYRIMMVEDDEKIRRIVADTLKKWQYDVVEVTQFDQVLIRCVMDMSSGPGRAILRIDNR